MSTRIMMRTSMAIVALAAAILSPSVAFCQVPDSLWNAFKDRDVVIKKEDGEQLKGKLIGVDAETVVVLGDDGAAAVVPRAEVKSVRGAKRTPPPSPPEAEAPVSSASGTFVHIESDDPSEHLALYRVESDFIGVGSVVGSSANGSVTLAGSTFKVVCLAPCDQEVAGAPGQEFFLGGEGVTASSRFRLGDSGKVDLTASPGSRAEWIVGVASAAGGASGVVLGAVTLGVLSSSHDRDIHTFGGATLGIGAGLLALGIPLMLHGRTTYSLKSGESASRGPFHLGTASAFGFESSTKHGALAWSVTF